MTLPKGGGAPVASVPRSAIDFCTAVQLLTTFQPKARRAVFPAVAKLLFNFQGRNYISGTAETRVANYVRRR